MKEFAALSAFFTAMILASNGSTQTFPSVSPSSCPPDTLEIEDAGEGRAIVTYYNSVQSCSNGWEDYVLTSPAGISVSVTVTVNGPDNEEGREHITLTPLDPAMLSFPSEGKLLDGETQEFLIQGGIS